jgi:hypothetical protein
MMKGKAILVILLLSKISLAQQLPSEKIMVHLSKTISVVNDDVWFDLQVTENNGKTPTSKVAYFELINRNQIPVFQSIIPLSQGKAAGKFRIPGSLITDHYLFRAYTRISPFSDENEGVFNQFVTVINPQKGPNLENSHSEIKTIYKFKKPTSEASLAVPNQVQKNAAFEVQLNENNGPYTISVSYVNPFLPGEFNGSVGKEIYKKSKGALPVIPEIFGHIIHGKVLEEKIDTAATFFLSAHGDQSVLYSAKPNEQGNLFFDLGALKSFDFLIAQSLDPTQQLNFSIQSPFHPFEWHDEFQFPDLVLKEKDLNWIEDLILSAELGDYFYPKNEEERLPIATGLVADRVYLLDDYNRFETIEVTLREYMPEVLVRKQNRNFVFKVLNTPVAGLFQDNPLILIDAMPVFDTNKLASFDPSGIEKLEILTREFFFNKDKFPGVLSFTSFENDFGKFELPENALYLEYFPIHSPYLLTSNHFNPHIGEDHYPDFRSSLYWEDSTTNSTINIIPSSLTGTYEIIVSSHNENGEKTFVRKEFIVVD